MRRIFAAGICAGNVGFAIAYILGVLHPPIWLAMMIAITAFGGLASGDARPIFACVAWLIRLIMNAIAWVAGRLAGHAYGLGKRFA